MFLRLRRGASSLLFIGQTEAAPFLLNLGVPKSRHLVSHLDVADLLNVPLREDDINLFERAAGRFGVADGREAPANQPDTPKLRTCVLKSPERHVQKVDDGQEAEVDDGKEGKGADGGGVEERRLLRVSESDRVGRALGQAYATHSEPIRRSENGYVRKSGQPRRG